jgi:hypothetical protein
MATVKNCFNEFQRGRTSVCDEPRSGGPKTATAEDNVTKLHDLVSVDCRLKVHQIGISKDHVGYILHEILGKGAVGAMSAAFTHSG